MIGASLSVSPVAAAGMECCAGTAPEGSADRVTPSVTVVGEVVVDEVVAGLTSLVLPGDGDLPRPKRDPSMEVRLDFDRFISSASVVEGVVFGALAVVASLVVAAVGSSFLL